MVQLFMENITKKSSTLLPKLQDYYCFAHTHSNLIIGVREMRTMAVFIVGAGEGSCSILRPATRIATGGVEAGEPVSALFKPFGKNRPLPPAPPAVTIAVTYHNSTRELSAVNVEYSI